MCEYATISHEDRERMKGVYHLPKTNRTPDPHTEVDPFEDEYGVPISRQEAIALVRYTIARAEQERLELRESGDNLDSTVDWAAILKELREKGKALSKR